MLCAGILCMIDLHLIGWTLSRVFALLPNVPIIWNPQRATESLVPSRPETRKGLLGLRLRAPKSLEKSKTRLCRDFFQIVFQTFFKTPGPQAPRLCFPFFFEPGGAERLL